MIQILDSDWFVFRNVGQPLYHRWGSREAALSSTCNFNNGRLCQSQSRQAAGRPRSQCRLDVNFISIEELPKPPSRLPRSTTDSRGNRQANQSLVCSTGQSCCSWQAGMKASDSRSLVHKGLFHLLDVTLPSCLIGLMFRA